MPSRNKQKQGKQNRRLELSSKTPVSLAVVPAKRPRPKNNGNGFNIIRDAWMATLVNPWSVHGVRIPDEITTPSATCSFRQRITVTPVADGTNYAAAFTFVPTLVGSYRQSTAYNASTGTFTMGSTNDIQGYSAFSQFCRQYRVVSAGFAVTSTTAMATNQGRNLCAFYAGADHLGAPFLSSMTTGALLIGENSADSPLNAQQVCSITWLPSDRSTYSYHTVDGSVNNTVNASNYYNPGMCAWAATGIASSASFEVTLCINIEYVPSSNVASFITQLPSRYDVMAMERALNSSLLSRIFGSATPEDVHTNTASSASGFSSVAGMLLSNFGNGVGDVLRPYAAAFGRAATHASLGYVTHRLNRLSLSRQLQGITG